MARFRLSEVVGLGLTQSAVPFISLWLNSCSLAQGFLTPDERMNKISSKLFVTNKRAFKKILPL